MIVAALIIATVLAAEPESSVDFDSQILPLLTKVGCNAGACHGAAAGRGGFHLSLFGSDAQADYASIVTYAEGRRVNHIDASKSLVLVKPLGGLDHGGDAVLQEGSSATALLRRWLEQGAQRASRRQLTELRVVPNEMTAKSPSDSIELKAIARFSDGEEADVTEWTQFRAEDSASVEILDQPTRARSLLPGKHRITARFWFRIVSVSILLPYETRSGVVSQVASDGNRVDQAIDKQLTDLNLLPAAVIDDPSFLRRLHLDLTGRLPKLDSAEIQRLIGAEINREQEIDKLLDSEDFSAYWALRLARWLKMRGSPEEPQATRAYSDWILESLQKRRPFNQVARELLTAIGDSHVVGAANFSRTMSDARQHAELVSSVMMGTRIQCANCHNHPFAQWTQNDYHGLAAIFAPFDRGRAVSFKKDRAVTNPLTGESAVPRIPGVRNLDNTEPALGAFTDWLLEKDNPYFAKAIVNRLWDAMMGRGLVSGVDDFRETNPPSHSQLLDELANDFVAHDYDLRRTIGLIANSNAYARQTDLTSRSIALAPWYGIATSKTLLPEVHLDAIEDVLSFNDRAASPDRQRKVGWLDPSQTSPDLEALGRCSRIEACQTQGSSQGLSQKLHAMNGDLLNQRISDQNGRLHNYLNTGMTSRAIMEDFYARALSRQPEPIRLSHWMAQLEGLSREGQTRWLEDFVWAILSSQNFATNR